MLIFALPACLLCDAPVEDPKHYFLFCPSFSALHEKLLASVAQLLGNGRHGASDKKKNDWFLNGISHDDFDNNVMFFSMRPIIYFLVQPFLLTSIPLCMFCSVVTCHMHCKQHKLS